MSLFAAIAAEVDDSRATGYKRIVHIRVTTDALLGSLVTVPMTPERARVLGRLLMVSGDGPLAGSVVADPSDYERMQEILVHPEDWATILRDPGMYAYVQMPLHDTDVTRVLGIPVSHV